VFVALVIQHAMRMRRIVLSSVACPAVEHFSTFREKARFSEERIIEPKMGILIFCTYFSRNFSRRKKN
jgi:hypothetical protein